MEKYLHDIGIYENVKQLNISKLSPCSASFLYFIEHVFLKGKDRTRVLHGMRLLIQFHETYAPHLFDFELIAKNVDVSTINTNEDVRIVLGWYDYINKKN